MRRTRWTAVLACFVTIAVISFILFDLVLRHRGWVPGLTAWGAVVAVVMTVLVLVAGLAVRRLREHRETWMTPIGAAVTAAGAQASAATGADGVARLYLVKGGDYEGTKAEAAGYTARTVKLEVKADGSVAPSEIALAKAGSHSVSFTVDKGATVTVSDPTNGSHTATAGPNDTQRGGNPERPDAAPGDGDGGGGGGDPGEAYCRRAGDGGRPASDGRR